MLIRRAEQKDIDGINNLLCQVLKVHSDKRPDIFKADTKKYTNDELSLLIEDDQKPIFVAVDDSDKIMGYAFCIFKQHIDNNILTDIKTLYIDDLCVDENMRGQHIGKKLYDYVYAFAKDNGCYNLTLNVWALNEGAMGFYKALGLVPQKTEMETIL